MGLYYVRLYSKGSLLKSDKFVKSNLEKVDKLRDCLTRAVFFNLLKALSKNEISKPYQLLKPKYTKELRKSQLEDLIKG